MEDDENDIKIYRIAILGKQGVGKTSIVQRFVNNYFTESYTPTENDLRPYKKLFNFGRQDKPEYCVLSIDDIFPIDHPEITDQELDGEQQNDKQSILIKILENDKITLKQKQINYLYLPKQIYAYIFVYDIRDKDSLQQALGHLQYVFENEKQNQWSTAKYLVASKYDLLTKQEKENFKNNDIQELQNDNRYHMSFVSSKENYKISELFYDIANKINNDQDIMKMEQEWLKEIQISRGENENKQLIKASKQQKKQQKKSGNQRSQDMHSDSDEDQIVQYKEECFETQKLKEYKSISQSTNECQIY